jgi:hypothetical protein
MVVHVARTNKLVHIVVNAHLNILDQIVLPVIKKHKKQETMIIIY